MVIIKTQTFTTERELNDFILQKMAGPEKKDLAFKVRKITPVPMAFAPSGPEKTINSTLYYVLESEETLENNSIKKM